MDLKLNSLFGVQGKKALVTGGGSGLGEMMATALVQNGAHVYIASRKEKQLKEVSERLTKAGPGKCEYIIADIGSRAGCDALVVELKKRTNDLQILINNSGTTWGAPFEDVPEKEGWDRVLGTNVKALFYVTAGCAPLLAVKANNIDPGRVICISSMAGISPIADDLSLGAKGTGLWSYHTSKGAANHLSQSLAVTLAKRCITVNAICPGVYPSKMTAFGFSENAEAIVNSQPMGRVGTPEDIGGLALFLCSRAASHITGALIPTDGGSVLSGNHL
ncbi:hypothetical protein RQP46_009456 [Phenoliferia psychrophenolica]